MCHFEQNTLCAWSTFIGYAFHVRQNGFRIIFSATRDPLKFFDLQYVWLDFYISFRSIWMDESDTCSLCVWCYLIFFVGKYLFWGECRHHHLFILSITCAGLYLSLLSCWYFLFYFIPFYFHVFYITNVFGIARCTLYKCMRQSFSTGPAIFTFPFLITFSFEELVLMYLSCFFLFYLFVHRSLCRSNQCKTLSHLNFMTILVTFTAFTGNHRKYSSDFDLMTQTNCYSFSILTPPSRSIPNRHIQMLDGSSRQE